MTSTTYHLRGLPTQALGVWDAEGTERARSLLLEYDNYSGSISRVPG